MSLNILVIDDEDVLREEIAEILRENGYKCDTAANGKEGLAMAQELKPDLIISDIIMPLMGGIELLAQVSLLLPQTQVIVVTAYGTLETAIEALRQGACDYILKPIDLNELLAKIKKISQRQKLGQNRLRREISQEIDLTGLIGNSKHIQEITSLINNLKGNQSSVLIKGETGTGKELLAKIIHNDTCYAKAPFVAVNCAAIPENLFESELFGHVRGAFTGATHNKVGFIEMAHQGTLFLDEIGELSVHIQAKLLRVLEEKSFYRVGSTAKNTISTRFIAATHRNLENMIEAGTFRQDLFYRIRVLEILLPSLRERCDDIPLLVEHFILYFSKEMNKDIRGVENSAMQALMSYQWPGNIRELKNAIERAMLFQQNGFLELKFLPPEITGNKETSSSLEEACKNYEKAYIEEVLRRAGGNRSEAARQLGIDRSTLYRKLNG